MRTTNDGLTAIIEPGDVGYDYWSFSATLNAATLKAMGATYVIRYIGVTNSKVFTRAECTALHAAGIAVIFNYEGSASDYLTGAVGGAANGRKCREWARAFGYPEHLPIICSIDTGLSGSKLALAEQYARAFVTAANPYGPGLYGGDPLFKAVADRDPVNWRANASSWSGMPGQPSRWWRTAAAYERALEAWYEALRVRDAANGLVVHVQQQRTEGNVDPNRCLHAFAGWLPHVVVVKPPPAPEAPTPTTPPITEDLMHVLLEVHEAQGRKLAAMFYATLDSRGTATQCEWTGDGNPATRTGRKLQDHLAHGMEIRPIGIGSMADMTRLGPCPPAEALHAWSDADFASTIG